MMHLHGKLGARFDVQELHLKAGTDVEGRKKSPRPVVAHVLLMFLTLGRLELGDERTDVLRLGPVGDQDGVGRIDDDRSFTPMVETSPRSECT